MKIPMHYQVSECDCCPTTFINALIYLYEREEIPSEVINGIYNYTLDRPNCRGTTRDATTILVEWLNNYSKDNNFNLECERYEGSTIDTNFIKEKFQDNNVIILRLWSEWEHYILITKISGNNIYLFDPEYEEEDYDDKIKIVLNNEFCYNRIVDISRFDSTDKKEIYAMGELEKRECIVVRRK